MKRLIFVMLWVFTVFSGFAQSQTIIISEGDVPYTDQTWFCSGSGGALQSKEIKSFWDQGKRITSVAHTGKGWFVAMSKNSGLDAQSYKQSAQWPSDWISEKWNGGMYITSMSYGEGEWLVVMSETPAYTNQSWKRDTWSNIAKWINEQWDKGYYITCAGYNGSQWTVVMSQTDEYTHQGFFWTDSSSEVVSRAKSEVWKNDNNVQLVEYGGSQYLVVFCKYAQNNSRKQNFAINPSDAKDYIQTRWDNSQLIAYIGGGMPSSQTNTGGTRVTNTQNGIPYVDELTRYAKYDHIQSNLGKIVKSDKNVSGTGQITYTYEYDSGWKKTLSISKCPRCAGSGRCTAFHGVMGLNGYHCPSCNNTGNCGQCGGSGKWIYTLAINTSTGWGYSSGGQLEYYGGGTPATPGTNVDTGGGAPGKTNSASDNHEAMCKYCKGSGNCSSCNGKGYKYNPYSHHDDQCPSCNGIGRCFNC